MKKIVLSLALISGLVFTSCKKEAAQENLDNKLDSISEQTKNTALDEIKEEVVETVQSLDTKIKEAEAELAKAVTVEEKQTATKKLNEAKAALATLKGETISTAEEVKQETTKKDTKTAKKTEKIKNIAVGKSEEVVSKDETSVTVEKNVKKPSVYLSN